MAGLINILLAVSSKIGYLGVVLLMTIESSFIPFPSEIIIPPAAYLASQGQFNIYLVILSGIVGSLIGATINYVLAITLGRRIVYALVNKKIARLFLLSKEKLENAENYFLKYGNISTFLGRLVPAVRQLISIPAGFSRLNFKKFIIFTALGSALWTTILAILGYYLGAEKELLNRIFGDIKLVTVLTVIIIIIIFLLIKRKKS